jgi:hypothetical protein
MYEAVSWNDGKKRHSPPDITARWTFIEGKTMSIIHNRVDPQNTVSTIGWGYGKFKDGKFTYAYPEFVTIKGKPSNASVTQGGPFEGERQYSIEFDGDRMVMTSASGKQVWEVTPEGMRYTDQEWGPHKTFAQRVWKRITQQ